jgi:hypothetical protein
VHGGAGREARTQIHRGLRAGEGMARIPDGVIERLKRGVSVQRLAEARGVLFTPHSADLIGRLEPRCPLQTSQNRF